jgi:hypothetical protein
MIVTIVIVGIVVLAWVAWATHDKQRQPTAVQGIRWFEYGLSLKAAGAFFALVLVSAPAFELLHERPARAIVIGMFTALIGGPIFLLAFFWKVGYDASGIYARSPWRARRFVPWSDVVCFGFSDIMKQWVINTRSQGNVRINELVPGVKFLVQELQQRGINDHKSEC